VESGLEDRVHFVTWSVRYREKFEYTGTKEAVHHLSSIRGALIGSSMRVLPWTAEEYGEQIENVSTKRV